MKLVLTMMRFQWIFPPKFSSAKTKVSFEFWYILQHIHVGLWSINMQLTKSDFEMLRLKTDLIWAKTYKKAKSTWANKCKLWRESRIVKMRNASGMRAQNSKSPVRRKAAMNISGTCWWLTHELTSRSHRLSPSHTCFEFHNK